MQYIIKNMLLLVLSTSLWSMDVLEIVDHVNARDDGLQVTRNLKMQLTNKHGQIRVQATAFYRKYYGKNKKSIMFYEKPKRLKGTGFLTFDNFTKEDEQWLYLPALRKVRRVSSSDRGDWFLGTDFSYEDIKKEGKISKEDYDFKLLGEEKIDGHNVYKIESTVKNEQIADELGYSKLISYIDKGSFVARKVIFYDERKELLKTLHSTEITLIENIWSVHHMHMQNHQNQHTSDFYFSNIDYKSKVSDNLFTKMSLKRGR